MLRNLIVCCLTALLLMFTGHQNAPASETAGEAPVNSTDSPPPVSVTATAGKHFSLTLPSNPTTGYGWKLVQPLDSTFIKLLSTEYQASTSKLDGAEGTELWRFQALKAGKTTIRMHYSRTWEKQKEPAKTATFTITVN